LAREKTVLEKLLDILPGFHGYKAKEYLREDDQLIREYVYRIMVDSVRNIENAIARVATYDFSSADILNEFLRDLRFVMDKIRWAEHGYSPHYDIIKIKEEDLEKIKNIDEQLVSIAMNIKDKSSELLNEAELGNPIRPKIGELKALISRVRDIIFEREKLLREWGAR